MSAIPSDSAASPRIYYGCDLSHFQVNVQFHDQGVDFNYLKATQGSTYIDPTWADRIARALTVRPTGPYHFADPLFAPKDNADHFFRTIEPFVKTTGFMLPAIDIEETKGWNPTSQQANVDWLGQLLREFESEIGKRPLIYTPTGWFRQYFGNADFSGHPFWIPAPGMVEPEDLGCWKDVGYAYFQYSWKGTIPGAGTNSIDTDKGPAILLYN